jgi:hypothetical protein
MSSVTGPISHGYYTVEAPYVELLRAAGLVDAMSVFESSLLRVWRDIPERQNCTLDIILPDQPPRRLHIKRFRAARRDFAREEAEGIRLLRSAGIMTTPLVATGRLNDGRGFIITDDLAGFAPLDRRVSDGFPFERALEPTAALAAQLHDAKLRHRDLYLCHFFARIEDDELRELALIDAARVTRLPRFFAGRWIVKDLAQFRYSTMKLPISDEQRDRWFDRYASMRRVDRPATLLAHVVRKTTWIARHDASLRKRQPGRDVSLSH